MIECSDIRLDASYATANVQGSPAETDSPTLLVSLSRNGCASYERYPPIVPAAIMEMAFYRVVGARKVARMRLRDCLDPPGNKIGALPMNSSMEFRAMLATPKKVATAPPGYGDLLNA